MIKNEEKQQCFLQKKWRITVVLLGVFFSILFYVISQKAYISILLGALTLCWISFWLGSVFFAKKRETDTDNIFTETDIRQLKVHSDLPFAYAVVNRQKKILFCNALFEELFSVKIYKNTAVSLEKLLPTYIMENKKQSVAIEKRTFDVYSKDWDRKDEIKNSTEKVYSLCFVETTAYQNLEAALQEQQTVVALLLLDNYEEVIDALEESLLPALTADIDKTLNALAAQTKGIMKKFEKDRYLFLFSQKQLELLKEKKFEILNQIREISVGEHIPVTISMGIGIGKDSLETAMKNAKAAVDLALGRGGDQVLIKDGEKYLFYGGKSGEVSHNARIRARVKADALWEMMREVNEIFVMGHKKADLDSTGACVGIHVIAKTMGKNCYIVLDEVSAGIKRLHERLMEKEEYVSTFITQQQAVAKMSEKSLVVVVDTHRKTMTICPQLLQTAKKIVVFDHHRKSTDFIDNAVLIYHEPYASSTCELITEMIQYFGEKIKLKPVEADALLAGITVDTKNFCVKTGAITFEAAAFLRRHGADSVRVRLLFQNDMASYQAKASAVKDAKIIYENMAFSVCPTSGENSILTAAMAADDLLNIVGIKASFVCCLLEDTVYISARSLGEINVQMIMEKLGGGGHMTVSGAQLTHCSVKEAEQKLKQAIESYLKEETK